MSVKHSRKGVKHPPGHVKPLLETPETQICALPSLLRIRMVLMAAGMAPSRVHWQLIGGDGPVLRSHHPLREEIAESVADHAENAVCD
jgi:hypothetical protein